MNCAHAPSSLRLLGTSLALAALSSSSYAQLSFFTATLDGAQETPAVTTPATGIASVVVDTAANTLTFHIEFGGLTSAETLAHIHGFAPAGTPAGILYSLPLGSPKIGTINYLDSEEQGILAGQTYVNIHTSNFSNGEIRGQLVQATGPTVTCFGDGTFGACPCGNNASPGLGGCLNSIGTSGITSASGFASLTSESLTLSASGIPTGNIVFFQGDTMVQPPLFSQGNGLRCAGGQLLRLKVATILNGQTTQYPSPGGGDIAVSIRGQVTQPGTRIYQTWYQDPNPLFCTQTGYNVTNAVQITWVP